MISCGILGTTAVSVFAKVGGLVVEIFESIRGVGRGCGGFKLGAAWIFVRWRPCCRRDSQLKPNARANRIVISSFPIE